MLAITPPLSAAQLREQISRNLDGIILNTLEQKSADGKNNPAPGAGPPQFLSSNGAAVTGQSGTCSAQAGTGTAVASSSSGGVGEHNDDDPLDAFMGNLGKELQEKVRIWISRVVKISTTGGF